MKCPLAQGSREEANITTDCIKEECAWWLGEACAVQQIGKAFSHKKQDKDNS